jgi:hypothetical protein
MMPTFGRVGYGYAVVEDWEQLSQRWKHADVAGVATDARAGIYLFTRDTPRVIV